MTPALTFPLLDCTPHHRAAKARRKEKRHQARVRKKLEAATDKAQYVLVASMGA